MPFPTAFDAIQWSYEMLSCTLKSPNPEREATTITSTSIGNTFLVALDIKIQTDRVAHRLGATDHRGNWLYLSAIPSDTPMHWREWQVRKIDTALKELSDTLYRKGYIY